jgi:hypothetical protein
MRPSVSDDLAVRAWELGLMLDAEFAAREAARPAAADQTVRSWSG